MHHDRLWQGIGLLLAWLGLVTAASAQGPANDPLPSWNEGAAKSAILRFVKATTTAGSPEFVPVGERIATFDQDGTLWVEHPLYTQVMFCLERLPFLVKERPELAKSEAFQAVQRRDHEAIARLPAVELAQLLALTLSGLTVDQFQEEVKLWLSTARHPRWQRPYVELTFLPMQEALRYLREHGYKTYIVTGGGQDFVRAYAELVYGIPPEQVVGSMGETRFRYNAAGEPELIKDPRLLLKDDGPGKAEGIHLLIGRRPRAAFGNSVGDQQMLEYTGAGVGARLMMLVLHDDAQREYAYGPARGLPESRIGTFPPGLLTEAETKGWVVISMKSDWKRVFSFEAANANP
ncbi:HAD family hydrolase [Planctomicrobium sp. SH664]|uniref:HAD family hydrolase n=1 Tax=Planctomicrobium sp. SH664 TaxID=3448125 RepID=UPI003F5BC239